MSADDNSDQNASELPPAVSEDNSTLSSAPSDDNSAPTPLSETRTTDPVRDLLGERMTPEERKKKRDQLLKMQQKARERQSLSNSTAPDSAPSTVSNMAAANNASPPPTVASSPEVSANGNGGAIREDMVQRAVQFLTSPNVRSAPRVRKVTFLEKKGLTPREIEVAFERIGPETDEKSTTEGAEGEALLSSTTNTKEVSPAPAPAPPPLPAKTYVSAPSQAYLYPGNAMPPQGYHYPYATQQQMIQPVSPWKGVVLTLLLTGALAAGVLSLIKRLALPYLHSIIKFRSSLFQHQNSLLAALSAKLKSMAFSPSSRDPSEQPSASSTDNVVPAVAADNSALTLGPTLERLQKLQASLISYRLQATASEETRTSLLTSLGEVIDTVAKEAYSHASGYNSGSWRFAGENNAVAQVKSEIRSLKGVLLNRRNFPTVPTVASSLSSGVNRAAAEDKSKPVGANPATGADQQ
ncbi:uncharacterized protein VTP21DRAFT_8602 [Calcarisporiella thermophila]|uniref:uncharacterized protein n=1 Tax=Calcarisporiella thermophila TaxID=911321 RepID=UPI0037442EC0